MNPHNSQDNKSQDNKLSQDNELRRREQELQNRERSLRLRELEADVMQPPITPTVKHDRPGRMEQQMQDLVKVAKFVGLIAGAGILFVVVFRVGTFLASMLIVGIIGWVVYKLFLESNRPKR